MLVEICLGLFDTKGIVIGVCTHIHEIRVEDFLHGILKVSCVNFATVVPLQIVAEGDFPSVAAFCLLCVGVAPLILCAGRYVFQLGCRRVVRGVRAAYDCVCVDFTVSQILFIVFELVVIIEERRADVAQNLGVVVVRIGKLVPVAGHGCRQRAVGSTGTGRFVVAATNDAEGHYETHCHCKTGFEFLVHVLPPKNCFFFHFSRRACRAHGLGLLSFALRLLRCKLAAASLGPHKKERFAIPSLHLRWGAFPLRFVKLLSVLWSFGEFYVIIPHTFCLCQGFESEKWDYFYFFNRIYR